MPSARRLLLRPEAAAVAGTMLLLVGFNLTSPLFLTAQTFQSITSMAAELGIEAIGVTLLMIGGHFDLSIGATLGASSYLAVWLINDVNVAPFLAFALALLAGAGFGLVNGLIVTRTHLHSFVVTLGTSLIFRGLLTIWTAGFPIQVTLPDDMTSALAGQQLGGFRMSLVWLGGVAILATFILLRTRLGNWIFAVGQNPQAARNLGVPVEAVTVVLFAICGACGALAGLIQVARFGSIDALRGSGTELTCIAITVIGGTLLTGGYGSAIGTVFGAIIFSMMELGLVLAGVPGYYFSVFVGLVLILSVFANSSLQVGVSHIHLGLPGRKGMGLP